MSYPTFEDVKKAYEETGWRPVPFTRATVNDAAGCASGVLAAQLMGLKGPIDSDTKKELYDRMVGLLTESYDMSPGDIGRFEFGFDSGLAGGVGKHDSMLGYAAYQRGIEIGLALSKYSFPFFNLA